jgi:aminobenzoyl-glutamate transport protein
MGAHLVRFRLPDPVLLFLAALLVAALASMGLAGEHPGVLDPRDGTPVVVRSLLAPDAMAESLSRVVPAFTSFPPLGVVLVMMLGVGIAERAGLVAAALGGLVRATPARLLTPAVVLAGILSHVAADAGFVVVIPLAAVAFQAAGRHPLAGVAAAFAGVSGSFGANLVPGPIDPLLAGLTQQAARLVDPETVVSPLCNLRFTASSAVLLIGAAWFVTDRFVEPRLRPVAATGSVDSPVLASAWAGSVVAALCLLGFAAAAWPETSPLRDAEGALLAAKSPAMAGIVPLLALSAALAGLAHGFAAGVFKSHRDVVAAMEGAVSGLAGYLVLAFFAAIFLDAFDRSRLGLWLAVSGGDALAQAGIGGAPALVGVVGFVALLNLAIASSSAKWALLAPILIPVGLRLGLSPEAVTAAYRVGDSSTNIVTPLMPYFPLVLATCRRHQPDASAGDLLGAMWPYTAAFLPVWIGVVVAFHVTATPWGW